MNTQKEQSLELARECERLARASEARLLDPGLSSAQKIEAADSAKAYWQMAQNWTESALHAEQARPTKFTGQATGERKATTERKAFLLEIAGAIGTSKHEAIAAEAVAQHSGKVRSLWRAEGAKARDKILNFLRNNSFG